MRTYIKGGSKMLKIVKQKKEMNENTETEEEMKMKKLSLKKKVLIGVAAGVAGVVSIIAYGKSKPSNDVECNNGFDDDDDNEQFLTEEEKDRQSELGNDETTKQ